MTNRADRGLELLAELGPISEQEFSAIKHDKSFSEKSRAMTFLQTAIDVDLSEQSPEIAAKYGEAQEIITRWDRQTDVTNRGAALSACVIGTEWLAEQKGLPAPNAFEELKLCADKLMANIGRIDPLWGDVSRHVRGDLNPVCYTHLRAHET